MNDKELRKLSKKSLIKIINEQNAQIEAVKKELSDKEEALNKKEIVLNQAGSIAEAALLLNGVFDAAEAAAGQYLRSISLLNQRQSEICAEIEADAKKKADKLLEDTKMECDRMVAEAKAESESCWEGVSGKLETLLKEREELNELMTLLKKD